MNYEESIINYLIENGICEDREEANYYACMKMHTKEALDAFLRWEGIIGYTTDVLSLVEDYTPAKYTYFVCTSKKTLIYRDYRAYKASVARLKKQAEDRGQIVELEHKHESGLGWVDNYTIIKVVGIKLKSNT